MRFEFMSSARVKRNVYRRRQTTIVRNRLQFVISRTKTSNNYYDWRVSRRFQKERVGRGPTGVTGAAADESQPDDRRSPPPPVAVRQRVQRVHADRTRRAGHGLRRGKAHARSALLRVPCEIQRPQAERPHHVPARLEVQRKCTQKHAFRFDVYVTRLT